MKKKEVKFKSQWWKIILLTIMIITIIILLVIIKNHSINEKISVIEYNDFNDCISNCMYTERNCVRDSYERFDGYRFVSEYDYSDCYFEMTDCKWGCYEEFGGKNE